MTYRDDIFAQDGYLAGSDARRADELYRVIKDPSISAIFVARGGYGSLRLLHLLSRRDYQQKMRKHPKILSGMSDLTVLLNHVAAETGVVTIHGPVLAGDLFEEMGEGKKKNWFAHFSSAEPRILRPPSDYRILREGQGRGRLWGGNLSMVAATIGTPYEIPSDGLLFLEEVSEPRYRIDRMLAQLALAGFFARIRGLILGDFSDVSGKSHRLDWIKKLLEHYVNRKIPILSGLKAGHKHADVLLPIGGKVRIEAKSRSLVLGPLTRADRS